MARRQHIRYWAYISLIKPSTGQCSPFSRRKVSVQTAGQGIDNLIYMVDDSQTVIDRSPDLAVLAALTGRCVRFMGR